MNRHVWSHAKTAYRFCRECGQEERKVVDVDCTKMKRVGRWCEGCASLLAKKTVGEYIMPTEIKTMPRSNRHISGRPLNTERLLKVRELIADGKSYGFIKKELGITDTKTLWRYKNYPEEKLKKQLEYAKIPKA